MVDPSEILHECRCGVCNEAMTREAMTYTLSKLRDGAGNRVEKPERVRGVTLDIDKNRRAYAFLGSAVAELRVMEFEAHAKGLFLRGFEPLLGDDQVRYQEWFLAYDL